MKFKTKVAAWFSVGFGLIALSSIGCTVAGLAIGDVSLCVVGVILTLFVALYGMPVLLNTYYLFDEKTLYVRGGIFSAVSIFYSDVVSFSTSKNPITSYALSLDRIEIVFRHKGSVQTIYVSPKNKNEFLSVLKEKCQLTADLANCSVRGLQI